MRILLMNQILEQQTREIFSDSHIPPVIGATITVHKAFSDEVERFEIRGVHGKPYYHFDVHGEGLQTQVTQTIIVNKIQEN